MTVSLNAAEVFRIAIEIEENGKNFYEKSQSVIDDSEVRELFADLARQEVEHKKKFQEMKAELPPHAESPAVWDPDNELDQYIKMTADQHVFASSEEVDERLARVKNVKDALKLAIEFEKDSVIFFLSLQEATYGKKSQELISLLVKEEQEHLRRLSLQLARLTRK